MIPMYVPQGIIREVDYCTSWNEAISRLVKTPCARQHYLKKVEGYWVLVCCYSDQDFKNART
jgi:hypothetical protein